MTTQASGPVVATATFEILEPGIQTTVQDHPGRVGLQSKGFFPSGAMDHFALRAANALVGNPPGAAGLEIPMGRFRCRFDAVTTIAVCGADGAPVQLDGVDVPMWQTVRVPAGGVLAIGVAKGPGFRLYVAVAGGVAVPEVMGSRATYTMGALGGLDGRAFRKGDVLPIGPSAGDVPPRRLPERRRPEYTHGWTVEVMRGPQADPDFLTPGDWELLVGQQWKVDLNSNRVGIRLGGAKFTWARSSGGVAGGHPSNILDTATRSAGSTQRGCTRDPRPGRADVGGLRVHRHRCAPRVLEGGAVPARPRHHPLHRSDRGRGTRAARRPEPPAGPGDLGGTMSDQTAIDINCDVGESFGRWNLGDDVAIMPHITSVSIACGFHAGDPSTMRTTVRHAVDHGLQIGAHVAFPDLLGFGQAADVRLPGRAARLLPLPDRRARGVRRGRRWDGSGM